MAEQSSHDVVNQTLSGGDSAPSDVPATTAAKFSAGGDEGRIQDTTTTTQPDLTSNAPQTDKMDSLGLPDQALAGTDTGRLSTVSSGETDPPPPFLSQMQDAYRSGPGTVQSRALEVNGVSSASDHGDDTASQGGSESDASRADGRGHTRTGSVKKPATFKPVSFAKFSVNKAPGTPAAPKPVEKGMHLFYAKWQANLTV